jgi:hypothetical protein
MSLKWGGVFVIPDTPSLATFFTILLPLEYLLISLSNNIYNFYPTAGEKL